MVNIFILKKRGAGTFNSYFRLDDFLEWTKRLLHMLRILRVRAEGACPKLFPEKSEACVAEE